VGPVPRHLLIGNQSTNQPRESKTCVCAASNFVLLGEYGRSADGSCDNVALTADRRCTIGLGEAFLNCLDTSDCTVSFLSTHHAMVDCRVAEAPVMGAHEIWVNESGSGRTEMTEAGTRNRPGDAVLRALRLIGKKDAGKRSTFAPPQAAQKTP
jgi:hypothetical protein